MPGAGVGGVLGVEVEVLQGQLVEVRRVVVTDDREAIGGEVELADGFVTELHGVFLLGVWVQAIGGMPAWKGFVGGCPAS